MAAKKKQKKIDKPKPKNKVKPKSKNKPRTRSRTSERAKPDKRKPPVKSGYERKLLTKKEERALSFRGRRTDATMSQPGDVLLFNYLQPGKRRKDAVVKREVLVVRTLRASDGNYITANTNNPLLTCFKISINSPSFELIQSTLYKKRSRCLYYDMPKRLSAILKSKNFRTYNINKMYGVVELLIIPTKKATKRPNE
jgi:hypothetical protein